MRSTNSDCEKPRVCNRCTKLSKKAAKHSSARMLPQQQHDAMFAHNFAAHDLVHMALQRRHLARQLFDAIKGHHANLGIFQGDGIAGVPVIDNAIQANHLTRHLKACDLIAPVLGSYTGLKKPGSDGIQGGKRLAVVKQCATALDFAPGGYHVVNALDLCFGQAQRHTKLAQIAVGAGDFDGVWIHGK